MGVEVIVSRIEAVEDGKSKEVEFGLIREEPLAIRIQGRPYAVVMRTPGEEMAHVAGFCLSEGIVDRVEDIQTVASCEGETTNVVTLTVTQEREKTIGHILDRRGFVSQTSCGICGKELIEDLSQIVPRLPDGPSVDLAKARACLDSLKDKQMLYQKTRASHAAALYAEDFSLLCIAEDVGRHNALDKAIGRLFLERRLHAAKILILSSRISYELVQKAARAGIPFIMAASRPTGLAVQLAASLNITLASLGKGSSSLVYCGFERIVKGLTG